ncbi:hypothetical protein GCM10009850_044460 [Nonomuraea monospora]|uniref:Polymer-forming cytoskeletal protein n=1 Tax=Nonomuraea monospora TaxID=568818 RepID=A0ABN3CHV4_9ACTN
MNHRTQRLLAQGLLTVVGAMWFLLLSASPAAAGCGGVTYEQRQQPDPPKPANTWIIQDCDQTAPAVAAGLACALGVAATGLYIRHLHKDGAGGVAPAGQAEVQVIGPGEVRLGDVDGDVVIRGGTLVGRVSGTAVMVEGATFVGDAKNLVQIGQRNKAIGNINGKVVQAGSILGRVIAKGRQLWPLD